MLEVIIHGKLPSAVWNSEDVITSSIVGGFQLLSDSSYIEHVLSCSMNVQKELLKFSVPIKEVQYVFWPMFNQGEPDVVIILTDELNEIHLILIEAKYMSSKSSEEDESVPIEERTNSQRDQLSRQLDDLHDPETYKKLGIQYQTIASKQLIYLTNQTILPESELITSLTHSLKATGRELYWLSWSRFYEACCLDPKTLQDAKILTALREVCERKNFARYHGWNELVSVSAMKDFYSNERQVSWPNQKADIDFWSYTSIEVKS